jgi:Amt family ammonium transporter
MSLIVDGVNLDALNYTIKVPYNGTIMTGGDSLHADLNIFYDVRFLKTLCSRSTKLT